jgi:hypothetical protein
MTWDPTDLRNEILDMFQDLPVVVLTPGGFIRGRGDSGLEGTAPKKLHWDLSTPEARACQRKDKAKWGREADQERKAKLRAQANHAYRRSTYSP